jgi:hypothetical protein
MSTATSTISTSLTTMNELEMTKCTMYNLKMFGAFILFLLLSCIFSFIITPIQQCVLPLPVEQFSNDTLYSYKRISNERFSQAELLPPNTDQDLIGGIAKRYVLENSVNYEIRANLYLLNGNPFGDTFEQEYIVRLSSDSSNETLDLGVLKNKGDQLNTLKTSGTYDTLKFERINVLLKTPMETRLLITGLLR